MLATLSARCQSSLVRLVSPTVGGNADFNASGLSMSFRHAKSPALVCWTCGEALKSGFPRDSWRASSGLDKAVKSKRFFRGGGHANAHPLFYIEVRHNSRVCVRFKLKYQFAQNASLSGFIFTIRKLLGQPLSASHELNLSEIRHVVSGTQLASGARNLWRWAQQK